MRLLAAEARSTAGLTFPSQHLYGTILVTTYSMVRERCVSIAGPFLSPTVFPFPFFILCVGIVGMGSSD